MKSSTLLCGLLAFAGAGANAQLTSQVYVTGINDPTYVTNAGDGSDRLFVLDQTGKIRIVDGGGNLLADPFMDIDVLVASGGERGLLGLAFHPQYAANGKFYVNYTNNAGDTVVAEYTVSASDPDRADLLSGRVLLTIDQPYSNHNGGWIGFGSDDYLYISMGDGGSANDPGNRAQNLGVLLGKILRIDVDTQDAGLEYGIPADNPFQADGDPNTRGEIWDYGVRNAWRCSFDRETGDLWIADVGQNAWEEINYQPAGQGGNHYGWRCREGFNATGLSGCPLSNPEWVSPVHAYSHSLGCSITGGYAYRGCELGDDWTGKYFFSDYCTGTIWYLDPENNFTRSTAFDTPFNIVSFGEDEQGELYFTNISNNTVYKLVLTNPPDKNDDGVIDTCERPCPADLAEPFGTLNIFDLQAYIGLYNSQDPSADLAEPFGSFNIFDLQAYIGLYNQGCP